MTIAVATLGCSRKQNDLHSWKELTQLEGDYRLYINWERQTSIDNPDETQRLDTLFEEMAALNTTLPIDADVWDWKPLFSSPQWDFNWRKRPKFDQDQARLSSIVTARNMCIEYAIQTDCSHLLFIDADIVPPRDIIPKLLEVNQDAVCGLVNGRGCHSHMQYIFGEKRRWKQGPPEYELVEVEHANIGYTMLSRKLIETVRFRYGRSIYPDGRDHITSDDPAYHLDCFIKYGTWPVVRMDVVGQHVGDLKNDEISQF